VQTPCQQALQVVLRQFWNARCVHSVRLVVARPLRMVSITHRVPVTGIGGSKA
jgi:hypothetical protein